jgi:hypothetical protein
LLFFVEATRYALPGFKTRKAPAEPFDTPATPDKTDWSDKVFISGGFGG